ncbi:hypothetical protein [Portibacter lacus]|uniref:Uncharacterized protein n=1 Tax=Portibacter lacus TaxID=1099794 RepID=A0AA37SPB6_9BACT|nr:hypothetical protein [Portibacter lacus]GLR18368.1 hypothetical protein GCM10007940_29840 [Portibacter lacus]
MRKYSLFFLALFIISGCYKDTDYSEVISTERGPRIVVNTTLVGSYKSNITSSNAAFSLSINDVNFEIEAEQIPYTELKNVEKKGQLIEFFEDNVRTGAAQIPFVENEINYTQLIGTDPFSRSDFNQNLNLASDISLDFIDTEFSNAQAGVVTDGLEMVYNFSEEKPYLNQLVSFAYGKSGASEVVDSRASFYIGVENSGSELILTKGEIIVRYDGDSDLSLFYFNRDQNNWEWVSDFAQNLNTEKIVKTGWYVIGRSVAASMVKGHVGAEQVNVARQQLKFVTGDFQTNIFTTSKGNFECFIPNTESIEMNLLNQESEVILEDELNNLNDFIQIEIPESVVANNFLKSDFEVINCDGTFSSVKSINLVYDNGKGESFYLDSEKVSLFPVAHENFKVSSGNGPELDWSTDKGGIHYLSACAGNEDGFTFMKIRDDQKLFPAFNSEMIGDRTALKDEMNRINLILETDSKGSLSSDKINISIKDESFGDAGYSVSCENAPDGCGIEVCEITYYKEDGDEWNRIYFEGTIWMQTIAPAQAGNFNVEGYILSKR